MSAPSFPVLRSRARLAGAAVAVATALVLSGCSASDSGGATGSEGARDMQVAGPSPAQADSAGGGQRGVAPGSVTADKAAASAVSPVAAKLARKASIELRVNDLGKAASDVRAIAAAQQGFVVQESIGSGKEPSPRPTVSEDEPFGGYGTITLSVPAAALDATLTQLAKVGTVLARGSSSTDVTSQYVDTDSRIKTMRASVERVRSLMSQAKDVGQVVTLESELSRRQADLESLESQLTALKDQVEQSTVSVSLATPGHVEAAEAGGFMAGLTAGWDAFVASARGLLTAVGAVLPFALFLALVGLPVVLWLRRRTAGGSVTVSPVPDAPAAP